jgi:hypothetical protein
MDSKISTLLMAGVLIVGPQFLRGQISKDSTAPAKVVASSSKPEAALARSNPDKNLQLTLVKTVALDTVETSMVGSPKCDSDENFYLSGMDRGLTISKFNSKGESVAIFKATSSPDVSQFDGAKLSTVSADGEVYQLVFPHSFDRDVFLYAKDGSYKSVVKLEVSKGWSPSLLVAFPSGNFMATGKKWDKLQQEYVPFTGIFSSSGTLLKELQLEDDSSIGPIPMGLNPAISRGSLEVGGDGNVYLLRALNPAIVYAISPGGEITRRFTINPGDDKFRVGGMAVAGNRIAVMFLKGDEGKNIEREVIEAVDLEGNPVATYEAPMVDGHLAFGVSLACYTHNPEQFTFLGWTKDEKPVLNTAEPR